MSILTQRPSLFNGPPPIPKELTDILKYEIQLSSYYKRLKNLIWASLEIVGVLLLLGLIWLQNSFVKIAVTVTAIAISLVLFIIINRIL